MEKYNQIKDELQKEFEAFKIVENEYVAKHEKHIQDVKELKSNLKSASNKYIRCSCNSIVRIINMEAHSNTTKHILSMLPKSK